MTAHLRTKTALMFNKMPTYLIRNYIKCYNICNLKRLTVLLGLLPKVPLPFLGEKTKMYNFPCLVNEQNAPIEKQ